MKLLPPKEINTKIAEQKKTEIDAGLFLAKKIDALREDLADKQVEHDNAVAGLEKEFAEFSGEQAVRRETLTKEVDDLDERRKTLLLPLDEAWAEFHRQNDELVVSQNKVLQREYIANEKEASLTKQNEQITKLHNEAVQDKEEANKLLRHAESLHETRNRENSDFVAEKNAWTLKKGQEEKDIERRKIEADNSKKEFTGYIDEVKKKSHLLDLKLRKQ